MVINLMLHVLKTTQRWRPNVLSSYVCEIEILNYGMTQPHAGSKIIPNNEDGDKILLNFVKEEFNEKLASRMWQVINQEIAIHEGDH